MASITNIPHLDRAVPGARQQGEGDVRDKSKPSDILSMTVLYTFASADGHRARVSICSPDHDCLIIAA